MERKENDFEYCSTDSRVADCMTNSQSMCDCMQGWGTGGLSFFETIHKSATGRAGPSKQPRVTYRGSPGGQLSTAGGVMTTVSDLHQDHHLARPELYDGGKARLNIRVAINAA